MMSHSQTLCLAQKSTNYVDVLITMRDADCLCSPCYNHLHVERYQVRSVQSRASPQCKIQNQQLELHRVCFVFTLVSLSAAVQNRAEYEVLLNQLSCLTFRFLTSIAVQKTNPFWMSAYQLDQASAMSNCVVENKKSTQNKHYQHEAELCFKEGRHQSELNPPPHYWLQIVGDIKVASRLPS